MWEETNLHVSVERLLLEQPTESDDTYKRFRSVSLFVLSGSAAPGHETEEGAGYGIVEVAWLNLHNEDGWPALAKQDNITYPQLLAVQQALGYR